LPETPSPLARAGFFCFAQQDGVGRLTAKNPTGLNHSGPCQLAQISKSAVSQVSNLHKTSDSLGNSDAPPQIAPHKLGESLSGLDAVVESWPQLPPALKSAILAIINSSEVNR
jgi:hypothetical protein